MAKEGLTLYTGKSLVVDRCQICHSTHLEPILFLGYLPPVNTMPLVGCQPKEQSAYPAQVLRCPRCTLVQLGLAVDANILFPPEYFYTSGTTKVLRENFADLYRECQTIVSLGADDLVVDIGINDGPLLSNFSAHHQVQGVTPQHVGKLALARGTPTPTSYFSQQAAEEARAELGHARVITATNVFSHRENIHEVLDAILLLLAPNGVFISESHYLLSLVEKLQYDTIGHENHHYYSLESLTYLFESHGLDVIHAKEIPTHGGSIRVYAAHKGAYLARTSVATQLRRERENGITPQALADFRARVTRSKMQLHGLLAGIRERGEKVYGIGASSRATTLVNYVGLDDGIIDCVLEIKGSEKIGKYMPGTLIPVEEESRLFVDQPAYALLFSWQIADELILKLRQKGFRGDFIIPLPEPRILRAHSLRVAA